MAGTSTSVYKFDSVVRGQQVYKSVWTSLTDWCSKTRKCIAVQKDDKSDKYVCYKRSTVAKSERKMHTSREISRIS